MATPLAKAAKRAGSRTADPSTAAPAPGGKPKGLRYSWINFQVSALDPLRASPRPSRIDFFPSSCVSAGISASLRFTTNSDVYFVKFGTCGKVAPADSLAAEGAVCAPASLDSAAPNSPSDAPTPAAFLKNARLCIILLLLMVSLLI